MSGGTGGYQGSGGSGGISAGIYLQNSQNNTIYSNTISNLTGGAGGSGGFLGSGGSGGISTGIYLISSNSTNIFSNIFKLMSFSISLSSSSNNLIYNNFFKTKYIANFIPPIYQNFWNTTLTQTENIIKGNYIGGNVYLGTFENYSKTCQDNDNNGICDIPYDLISKSSCTSCSNNTDYLPLKAYIGVVSVESNPPTQVKILQANKENQLFTFSVQSILENILRFDIILPSDFNFISGSNKTTANATFRVNGNALTWENSSLTPLVSIDKREYFYFNTSVPSIGEYNFTVIIYSVSNESLEKNITFFVKSINITINLNSTIANPNDAINVYGKAILLPDNLNVSNENVSVYQDNVFNGSCATNNYGEYSCQINASSILGIHKIKVNITNYQGIYGENSILIEVRNLTFDQLTLLDSHNQQDNILNPNETYYLTLRIREFNGSSYFDVNQGNFNLTINGNNYTLVFDSTLNKWRTSETFNAPLNLGSHNLNVSISGISNNGIIANNINLSYYFEVKKIFIELNPSNKIYNSTSFYGKAILLPDNLPLINNLTELYFDNNLLISNNTDEQGNYLIKFNSPSLGIHYVKVNITNYQGIYGENSSNIKIWAPTNLTKEYKVIQDFVSNPSCAITTIKVGNYTRIDTNELIIGQINITIDGLTKTCYGYNCEQNFTIGTNCELLAGNKTIYVSAFNSSAFYELANFSFNYYLEDLRTSAQIIAYNLTVFNVSLTEDKIEQFNITVKNTGKGTIHNLAITKYSGPFSIINATPIPEILPESEINITFNITIPAGTQPRTYTQVYNASWINNKQQKSSIIFSNKQYVTVVGNPQIELSTYNITQTIQHNQSFSIIITINNTGNAPLQDVWVNYTEINLPKEWITISPNYWQSIDDGSYQSFTLTINIPLGQDPGLYRGIINVTSNLGYPDERRKEIEINVTVPIDSRWIMEVFSRNGTKVDRIEETYGLNEAGLLGNITIKNIGNVPLNFSISYTSLSATNPIENGIFETNKVVNGELYNPTYLFVDKQSSNQIKLWQNGYYVSVDLGLNITISNNSANPTLNYTLVYWHIVDVAPYINNLAYSEKIEINKLQAFSAYFYDDQNQLAIVYLNVTLPNSTLDSLICAQGNSLTYGTITCNYYPPIEGLYLANLTACDTGNKCRTLTFNFTAFAKAQLSLSPINNYFEVSGITQEDSKTISINFSISNLNDTVTAYNVSLTSLPPGGTSWIITSCNISSINPNTTVYCLLNVTIPEKTLPNTYSFRPYVNWNNADGSSSTAYSASTIEVNVLPTRIINLTYYPTSIVVSHNSSYSVNFTIYSKGNAEVRNISFECIRESTLCQYVSFSPSFISSFPAGEIRNITLTISLPLGFSDGYYYPIINITSIDNSTSFELQVIVPADYRYVTDKENITIKLIAGKNYTKNILNITNVGNKILTFSSLSLEGNVTDILSLTETYKQLNPAETFQVFANITAPNYLSFYEGNLTIYENILGTRKLPIKIEVYPAELTINKINPYLNVLENESIEINASFKLVDEYITQDLNFSVFVDNKECKINNLRVENAYWLINCSLPKLEDGRWHNLTLTAYYIAYDVSVQKTEINALYYKDVTKPTLISKEIPSVEYPSNVAIKLNLTDNVAIDKVLMHVKQLNQYFELTTENNLTWEITLTSLEPNDYDLIFYINDTTNNTLILEDYFEVFILKYVWVNITNALHEPINLNFTFYRNGTNQILQFENIYGYKNLSLHQRIYDLLIESDKAKIKIYNLSTLDLPNDFIKYDKIYSTEVNLYKPLGGFGILLPLSFNSTIRIYYKPEEAQLVGAIEDNLKIIYCSDYSFYEKTCYNWIQLPSKVNKLYKFVEANTTLQSGAYVIAEGIKKEARLEVYDPLPIDAHHGQKYTIRFLIESTGTDPVSNIRAECILGTICYEFNPEFNPFIGTLMPGESKEIEINVTIPFGYSANSYAGTLRLSSSEGIEKYVYLRVNVLNNYSFLVNEYFELQKGKGYGFLTNLTIKSIANNDLLLKINSSENLKVENEVFLQKLQEISIPVYYNLTKEGNYLENITLFNQTLNISKTIIFNITIVNFTLIVLEPINLIEVYPNQILNISLKAYFENNEITENISFRVLLSNKECLITNITNSFNISCLVPITKLYNDLIVEASYLNFTSYQVIPQIIKVIDNISPNITILTKELEINKNNTVEFLVEDNDEIQEVYLFIIYPNGTETNLNYYLENNVYKSIIFPEEKGDYTIKVFARDRSNNSKIEEKLLRAGEKVSIISFSKTVDEKLIKLSLELLNPISKEKEYLLVPDENATINASIFAGKYDVKVKIENHDAIYYNASINSTTINFVKVDVFNVLIPNVSNIRNRFFAFAIEPNFTYDKLRLELDISEYSSSIIKVSNLRIYKCSNWNLENRSCESNWIELIPTIDLIRSKAYIELNSSSAFLLAEAVVCGDNICDSLYEDCRSCSIDCGACPVTSVPPAPAPSYYERPSIDYSKIQEALKELTEKVEIKTEEIYVELKQGEKDIKKINIANNKQKDVYAEIMLYGEASQFIKVYNKRILLNKKSANYFELFIEIPKDAEVRTYRGYAKIIVENESFNIPITIKVLPSELKLLDLKISLLQDKVKPGDYLRAEVILYNLGKTKRVDVNLTVALIDSDAMIEISKVEESLAVETSLSKIVSLKVPENIPEKRYLVKAVATYLTEDIKQEAVASAFVTVEIPLLERKVLGVELKTLLLFAILIASSSAISIIFYRRYLKIKEKQKRFATPIDFSTLPQATENSAFIGNIAETARRAFIYLDDLKMHTMIAGATGSGKTIAAMVIAEEALLKGKNVIVFDPTAQWTGFLRKCKENYMLKEYTKFGMSKKQARGFSGKIKIIRSPYQKINLKEIIENPKGNIYIFVINKLKPEEIDIFVANTIQEIFNSQLEESKELRALIVYDEVHRLLPKFGGSGKGFIALERGVREFRKWGIGLILISQVLSDFVGEIRANIGTEIQMRTRYEGDLERIKMKYGEEFVSSIVKANVGTGMIVNAEYNRGRPYFVSFRPILHQVTRLSDKELEEYDKRDRKIEELKFYLEVLKKHEVDVFDIETELKLAESKLMQGAFDIVDIYLEGIEPRIRKEFEKRKIKMPKYVEEVSKEEIEKLIEKAKEEREKIAKEEKVSYDKIVEEIKSIEELIKELRKEGKDTFDLEIEYERIKSKLKVYEKTKDEKLLEEIKELVGKIKK
ncbi:MAG: DUF87 domain-containing protein [Candidatus Aenigmatarchaeota archaeon]